MTTAVAPPRRRDVGSMTLELAILAPALLVALAFAVAAGRIALAKGAVEAAARDAARQASIARDPATARRLATTSAQAALTREGLRCPARVTIHTAGFARPVGQPATVAADVTCTLRLADVALPGIPGSHTLTSGFSSPLDPHRAKSLGIAITEGPSGTNPSMGGT